MLCGTVGAGRSRLAGNHGRDWSIARAAGRCRGHLGHVFHRRLLLAHHHWRGVQHRVTRGVLPQRVKTVGNVLAVHGNRVRRPAVTGHRLGDGVDDVLRPGQACRDSRGPVSHGLSLR